MTFVLKGKDYLISGGLPFDISLILTRPTDCGGAVLGGKQSFAANGRTGGARQSPVENDTVADTGKLESRDGLVTVGECPCRVNRPASNLRRNRVRTDSTILRADG